MAELGWFNAPLIVAVVLSIWIAAAIAIGRDYMREMRTRPESASKRGGNETQAEDSILFATRGSLFVLMKATSERIQAPVAKRDGVNAAELAETES
jgi:hypothetical protein